MSLADGNFLPEKERKRERERDRERNKEELVAVLFAVGGSQLIFANDKF